MTPNEDLLWEYLVKMVKGSEGKRTTTPIDGPDIIKNPTGNLFTEDEKLGTDEGHAMVVTTAGPGTIDLDAGPLSRYWNAISDLPERVLISKDSTYQG